MAVCLQGIGSKRAVAAAGGAERYPHINTDWIVGITVKIGALQGGYLQQKVSLLGVEGIHLQQDALELLRGKTPIQHGVDHLHGPHPAQNPPGARGQTVDPFKHTPDTQAYPLLDSALPVNLGISGITDFGIPEGPLFSIQTHRHTQHMVLPGITAPEDPPLTKTGIGCQRLHGHFHGRSQEIIGPDIIAFTAKIKRNSYRTSHPYRDLKNGLSSSSRATVVLKPCPGYTLVPGGSSVKRFRLLSRACSSEPGKSQRPTDDLNRVSPLIKI